MPDGRSGSSDGQLVCPECGRSFVTPAGLGAHRSRVHGVAGSSRPRARSRSGRNPAAGSAATRSRRTAASAATAASSGRSATSSNGRRRARSRSTAGARQAAGLDRDALLRVVFPAGVPARAEVIAALTPWLEGATRLARLR